MKKLVIILMFIANILLCCALIIKNDAKKLEVIKVGGMDNYNQLQVLYNSDVYKQTQSDAILKFEAQLTQLANPILT
jgi:hypothetical protein